MLELGTLELGTPEGAGIEAFSRKVGSNGGEGRRLS
jgi:hypothetical protein